MTLPILICTDNVDIKIKFAPTVIERDGQRYIHIPSNKFKLAFDTQRLYVYLGNLFNGNRALGDNTNLFLNENWQIIFAELKPSIRETFTQILSSIINSILDKLPYDEMFNDLAIAAASTSSTTESAAEIETTTIVTE